MGSNIYMIRRIIKIVQAVFNNEAVAAYKIRGTIGGSAVCTLSLRHQISGKGKYFQGKHK